MKRSGRVDVLLRVLAYIEVSGVARIFDLMALTGYSRTAMFRLLRMAKDELDVSVEAVRGRGYVIRDWGMLSGTAVVSRHESEVKTWAEKKSSQKV